MNAKLMLAFALAWTASACGGNAPVADTPDVETPEPDEPVDEGGEEAVEEPLETGKDCVTAMALCDGGVCTAKVQNNCEVPVTCELDVLVMCRDETTAGEARGKGRDTFAAGTTAELQAAGNCEGRMIAGTVPDGMRCE